MNPLPVNPEHQDQIIEACLAEVLGRQSPPDLSEQILAALGQAQAAINGQNRAGQNIAVPIPAVPSPAAHAIAIQVASKPSATRSRPVWIAAALAASLAAVLFGYGIVRSFNAPDPGRQVGQAPQPEQRTGHRDGNAPQVPLPEVANVPLPPSPSGVLPERPKQPTPPGTSSPIVTPPHEPSPGTPQRPEVAVTNNPPAAVNGSPASPERPVPQTSSRTDEQVIASINQQIRRRWQDQGVKPAGLATDAEWVRRVYLDVLGRIPASDETSHFVADRSPHKKAHLLDELLGSDRGVEEYARNWANLWSGILIGRGQQPGSLASREGLHQYLRRAFLRNKPYDQFVTELVSAEGVNQPGEEGYNGAVNFLLDNLQENAIPATAKTARIFLGQQVQCTQCHNHPFNDNKQSQFWDLNSFFRQAKAVVAKPGRPSNGESQVVQLIDADFQGEGAGNLAEAEIYWEQRNGLMKISYPVFVDGTPISPSGEVAKVNRRDELARLMAQSRLMPQALVNRMWGHFLGYGFTQPVDDVGPHNPPSHPELLAQLADDFSNAGFDLRRLIRWIALSEPYGLSSRLPKETKDNPAAGESPLFSYFYLRQMRAEELYESLLVATGAHGTLGNYDQQQRTKSSWLEQFAMVYETDENDEATTFNGTISQTLMMWNGELIKRATSAENGSLLYEVAMSNDKPAAKVQQLFTAALSRKPTAMELQKADELWRQRQGDSKAALQDLWWAVLNSNEFIFNH